MTPETEIEITHDEATSLIYAHLDEKLNNIFPPERQEVSPEERRQVYQEIARELQEVILPESYSERIVEKILHFEANTRAPFLIHGFAVRHGFEKLAERYEKVEENDLLAELRDMFPEADQIFKEMSRFKGTISLGNFLLAQEQELTEEERKNQVKCLTSIFIWKLCAISDPFGFEIPDEETKRIIDVVAFQEGKMPREEIQTKIQTYLADTPYGFDLPHLLAIKRCASAFSIDPQELNWSRLTEDKLAEVFTKTREHLRNFPPISISEDYKRYLKMAESMGFTWEEAYSPETIDELCLWTTQELAGLANLRTENCPSYSY